MKFKNWIYLRKLHRSWLDLLPFFQVFPSSVMMLILTFGISCPQNLRSFGNLLPELDFTKFWRNTKCLCAETLRVHLDARCDVIVQRGNVLVALHEMSHSRSLRVGEPGKEREMRKGAIHKGHPQNFRDFWPPPPPCPQIHSTSFTEL